MTIQKKLACLCLILCLTLTLGCLLPAFPMTIHAENENQSGNSAMNSNITDMSLEGYVGEKLSGNVQAWQLAAYRDNRNVIRQILAANSDTAPLDRLLGTDWFGVDSRFELDVAEEAVHPEDDLFDGLLCYSPKKADAYRGDAGWRLDTALYGGVTDWSGADEIWVFVDASSFGADVYLRVNFEEGEVNENGEKTGAWEAYTPTQGKTARLISAVDGSVQETAYLWYSNDTLAGAGLGDAFFKIEKGFRGFLAYPIDNDHFWRYAGDGNNRVDKYDIHQITLSVGGAVEATVGKRLYFGLGATGAFDGGKDVPFGKGAAQNDRFVNVLPLPLTTWVLDLNAYVGTYVGSLYSDWDVTVQKNHGSFRGNALYWKQTSSSLPGGTFDRDVQFCNDPHAQTNWSGAKELWVYVDASEIDAETLVRFAFEEQHAGRESFSLIDGSSVVLYKNGEDAYRAGSVLVTSGGYVPLPEKFSGFVRMKLDDSNFTRYWNENGNNVLDLDKVVQFQLSVRGGESAVGKTVYMDQFLIVGDVNGEALDRRTYLGSNPADGSDPATAWKYVDPAYTAKTVWDLENVTKRSTNTGAVVIWYGEFVGKLLTGMAYSYRAAPGAELRAAAEEIITDLAAAQGSDGYLGVFTGNARFAIGADNWDLWNHYHCVTGLLEWYKLTGNETALQTAIKALDCIYDTFRGRSYLVAGGFETNRGIAHGYALAYQVTKDARYLAEARRIIDEDCQDENGWYKKALSGGDFYTSSSNRWEVLHMIMTLGILYEETGVQEYYDVMSAVWESILKTDVHNSGGFTTNEGAQGDPYMNGVIETCCTVAWMAFTNEYLKYNKTVRVADELERAYYNGMLGSLLDDEKYCSYNTPMNGFSGSSGGYDGRRVPSQQDISFQYNSGSPDMNCCQANLARGLGQISQWAAMTDGNELYLNYYGPCAITTTVGGKAVVIRQKTDFPVSGRVVLTVEGLQPGQEFTLKLRVPAYTDGAWVQVGGKTLRAASGEYFEVPVNEKTGTIGVNLGLHYTYLVGGASKTGLVSVYYGPVLLALDNALSQSVIPTVRQIETALPYAGETALLRVDVDVNGTPMQLVSFADAGKYNGKTLPNSYLSWLKVGAAPEAAEGGSWNNEVSHAVLLAETLSGSATRAFAGDDVSFTVNVPQGKELDGFDVTPETLGIVPDGEGFTFTMPDAAVTIAPRFKTAQSLLRYDVNDDGSVDIRDVTDLLNVLSGYLEVPEGKDLNFDGSQPDENGNAVTINDVTLLLNVLAGAQD